MTNEEKIEFFYKVKGKKIKWSSWFDIYFIPNLLTTDFKMEGQTFYIKNNKIFNDKFYIGNGFLGNGNGYWEFYNECDYKPICDYKLRDNKIKSGETPHKCNCDWSIVYAEGCKCGGI